jgi:Xaa-Pro dipeptidase
MTHDHTSTQYTRPFSDEVYRERIAKTKAVLAERRIDVLICTDPSNMNYLSGYDGWTFHMPQCLIVSLDRDEPIWIGRETEYYQARITSMLGDKSLKPYPERYFITCLPGQPFDFVADVLREIGAGSARIGIESQTYLMCARAYQCLVRNLPDADLIDAQWLVDSIRAVKSKREIEYMDEAARILESAMRVAIEGIEPGVRQCDLAAEIVSAQIRGADAYHGDYPSVVPLMASGDGTSAPHLTWTAQRYVAGEATTFELAGCRHRYHVPMGRTVFLGKPPKKMLDAAKYMLSGVEAALEVARPGAVCEEVELAWRNRVSRSIPPRLVRQPDELLSGRPHRARRRYDLPSDARYLDGRLGFGDQRAVPRDRERRPPVRRRDPGLDRQGLTSVSRVIASGPTGPWVSPASEPPSAVDASLGELGRRRAVAEGEDPSAWVGHPFGSRVISPKLPA